MLYKSNTTERNETKAHGFEVLSENATGISCEGGIVTIPKANYGHLAVDEAEFILMKYMKIDRNNAEIPQTVLLKAKRVANDVRISGQFENYIFDDESAVYLDLLKGQGGLNKTHTENLSPAGGEYGRLTMGMYVTSPKGNSGR